MLMSAGALSNLFSDSNVPYIVSRNVENAYCEAFDAINLGRSDCSADASLNGIGVGLKTFIHGNGRTLQKVAEFNKDSVSYRNLAPKEVIQQIAYLRNERIDFTIRTYGLTSMIYHCVTRKVGEILLFECNMDKIDILNIKNINSSNKNTITFEDGLNEYSFNLTKSTLYKRFVTDNPLSEIKVNILENPYRALAQIPELVELSKMDDESISHYSLFNLDQNVQSNNDLKSLFTINLQNKKEFDYNLESEDYVMLPLYSDKGKQRHVPERSGLNQWNANGRERHHDELYIPIPKWIHNSFPNFFPARDENFELYLPNNSIMSAKVCQDNSKALMSNPNKALGEWMLRQVLKLEKYELVTYEMLQILDIDSVIIYKKSDKEFLIDFCSLGSYDQFENENKQKK